MFHGAITDGCCMRCGLTLRWEIHDDHLDDGRGSFASHGHFVMTTRALALLEPIRTPVVPPPSADRLLPVQISLALVANGRSHLDGSL